MPQSNHGSEFLLPIMLLTQFIHEMRTSPSVPVWLAITVTLAPVTPFYAQIPPAPPSTATNSVSDQVAGLVSAAIDADKAGNQALAREHLEEAMRLDKNDLLLPILYEKFGGGRLDTLGGANALARDIAMSNGMSPDDINNTLHEGLILPPDLPPLPPAPEVPLSSPGIGKTGLASSPVIGGPNIPRFPAFPQGVDPSAGQLRIDPPSAGTPGAVSPARPLPLNPITDDGSAIPGVPPVVSSADVIASNMSLTEQINEIIQQMALIEQQIALEQVNNDLDRINELNAERTVLEVKLQRLKERLDAEAAASRELESEEADVPSMPKHIKVGETIEVFVLEDESFNGLYEVRLGGYILVPRVGRAYVEGKTQEEAEAEISDRLKEQVINASVLVERPNAMEAVEKDGGIIFLTGEFQKPGPFNIIKGRVPTLASAFIRAGGETHRADMAKVRVMRLVNGRNQIEIVDLNEIINGNDLGSDMVLRDGDIVQIPARRRLSVFEAQSDIPGLDHHRGHGGGGGGGDRGEWLSDDGVYVTGRVKEPGFIYMEDDDDEELTAYMAILAAEGFAPFADIRKIFVMRDIGGGHKIHLPIDLKHVWMGLEPDVVLKRTDIVVVPERFWSF